MRKATVMLAAVALATTLSAGLAGLAVPASAHSGGRVQLFVDRLALHSGGGTAWTMIMRLVDADSGTPQPGFDVVVEGHDQAGHKLDSLPMADQGGGDYRADVAAEPGNWEFAVRADSLPGGVPAVPLQKSYPVVLQSGKDVVVGASGGGRRHGGNLVVSLLWPFLAGTAVAAVALRLARRRRPAPVATRPSRRSTARS
jgi:hypothetical protein